MKKNLTISNKKILLIGLLIILGVIIRPIMAVAFLLFFFCILTDNDESRIIGLLIFTYPLAYVFKFSYGTVSLYTYLLVFAVFKMLVIRRKINRNFLMMWFFYAIYVLVGGGSISDILKEITIPLLIYFSLLKENRKYVFYYSKLFIYSILIVSFLGFFKEYIPNMASMIVFKSENLGYSNYLERFSAVWGDPNYYTVNLILSFTLAIYLHMKKVLTNLKAIIIYVMLIGFGTMTGSKSFLLMLILAYIFLIYETFKHHKNLLGFLLLFSGFSFVFLILSGKIDAFDKVLLRLSRGRNSVADFTSGRTKLWAEYTDYFIQNPIKFCFGNGMKKMFTFTAPHNTYFDYLDVFGLFGSCIFLGSIYTTIRGKVKKLEFLNIIPLLSLLICYFSLSMIRYLDFRFQIMMVLLVLCEGEKYGNKKQKEKRRKIWK